MEENTVPGPSAKYASPDQAWVRTGICTREIFTGQFRCSASLWMRLLRLLFMPSVVQGLPCLWCPAAQPWSTFLWSLWELLCTYGELGGGLCDGLRRIFMHGVMHCPLSWVEVGLGCTASEWFCSYTSSCVEKTF